MLVLSESAESKAKLDNYLLGCFTLQKLYGREPESYKAINGLFHTILASQPAEKVTKAFESWLERSQEFPTPADIINLIKRNGKPPLSEAQFIAISRKDGEDRTDAEWQYLRDYQAERDSGWNDGSDERTTSATLQENIRLRKEVMSLRDEVKRLGELLHAERKRNGLEKPKPSLQEKIAATIEAMRKGGASEADIEEFRKGQAA